MMVPPYAVHGTPPQVVGIGRGHTREGRAQWRGPEDHLDLLTRAMAPQPPVPAVLLCTMICGLGRSTDDACAVNDACAAVAAGFATSDVDSEEWHVGRQGAWL